MSSQHLSWQHLSISGISQLLLSQFWPNFKDRSQIFRAKKFLYPKFVGLKKFLDQKSFWTLFFWTSFFWTTTFLDLTLFDSKIFCLKCFWTWIFFNKFFFMYLNMNEGNMKVPLLHEVAIAKILPGAFYYNIVLYTDQSG